MSFSSSISATKKSDFNAAVDAAVSSPQELNSEAQELFEAGKEAVKILAAKFDNPDAFVGGSVSGHGCGDPSDGSSPFDSLSINVYETAAPVSL